VNRPPDRHDLSLTPANGVTLLIVCAVAAVPLAAMALSGRTWIGDDPPVWPQRFQAATERIDPNTASAASLRRLPGIGQVRADAIIAYRAGHGAPRFVRPEDLTAVAGIGPGTIRQIAPYLTLPGAAAR